jgi:origin recognition complex subunit 5
MLWPVYRSPVEKGIIPSREVGRLFAHLKNIYVKFRSTIFTHTISLSELTECTTTDTSNLTQPLSYSFDHNPSPDRDLLRSTYSLPYYSKYLLIATYLASYNPSKYDSQYFSEKYSNSTKKRKRNAITTKLSNNSAPSLPTKYKPAKSFPIGRLMAIFWSILPEDEIDCGVPNCLLLWSQITNLEKLKLINRISSQDSLDFPIYKCNIDFDSVTQIARNVKFSLFEYLHSEVVGD